MNERIPPHSIDAERSVLGSSLLDRDALYSVLEILKEEDFYKEEHKEIFRAIKDLNKRNEAVDIITVSDELKKRKIP